MTNHPTNGMKIITGPKHDSAICICFILVGGFNPLEKYESKWEPSSIFGVKIKHIWNHHLDIYVLSVFLGPSFYSPMSGLTNDTLGSPNTALRQASKSEFQGKFQLNMAPFSKSILLNGHGPWWACTAWWLNHPSEKYSSKWVHLSPSRGENKKCLKPPVRLGFFAGISNGFFFLEEGVNFWNFPMETFGAFVSDVCWHRKYILRSLQRNWRQFVKNPETRQHPPQANTLCYQLETNDSCDWIFHDSYPMSNFFTAQPCKYV